MKCIIITLMLLSTACRGAELPTFYDEVTITGKVHSIRPGIPKDRVYDILAIHQESQVRFTSMGVYSEKVCFTTNRYLQLKFTSENRFVGAMLIQLDDKGLIQGMTSVVPREVIDQSTVDKLNDKLKQLQPSTSGYRR